jgi:predicted metalloprotease with PDZ domain
VLLQLTESGYGGLEHRSSTALQARRADLPLPGQTGTDEGYVTLLGLFAHELFHAWHVKRMRPAELAEPDLDAETLTPLLWCFEGLTTYFEDLLVLRAGVAGLPRLLGAWSKLASSLAATPGRGVQSLADASREAWIKAYLPDAHSPNATVSYYVKGALLGLTLDVSLRLAGSSLDALMHALWRRTDGGPLCHADVDAALVELLGERQGRRLAGELQAWVHGTEELPLPRLLPRMGLQWQERPAPLARRLGLKLNESPLTGVRVQQVLAGGAAARGGLMPGDELLAVNGWRLRALAQAAQWLQDGQPLVFTVVRDERLQTVTVPAPDDGAFALVEVALAPRASETALARRRDWLGG